ncbi:hypothetical protein OEZ86_014293 [Tetradesmus obliquus]|nr:hypothetical protein OEZ86_014293 [Tetradesmus obliquus]
MQAPEPLIRGLLAKQQQQQQQQHFDAENPNTCVKIHAPEGLVFELNNRVQHKVANPGPGPRVHLVVDVFEDYRPRTMVPAGSSCEYGGQLSSLQQISTIMQLALQEGMDEAALAAEIQLLLATAGMACKTPEGERILPRVTQAAAEDLAKRAADQQALIDALFTGMQLQGVATQRQGTAADGNTQQQVLGDAAAKQVAQGSEAQQQQLPAHSQQTDPQRPAAVGQSLTGQSLTSAGTGGGAMRGLPFDQAALQKALHLLQQQALQQLQPGLAAAGVSGTKKAA